MKKIVLVSGAMSEACRIAQTLLAKELNIEVLVFRPKNQMGNMNIPIESYEPNIQIVDSWQFEEVLDQKLKEPNNVFIFDLDVERNVPRSNVLDYLIPRYIRSRNMVSEQFYFYSTYDHYEQEVRFIWPESFIKSTKCPEILLFNTNPRFVQEFGKVQIPLEKRFNYILK